MCVKAQIALDAAHFMAGTLLGHRMKCSKVSPELALNLEYLHSATSRCWLGLHVMKIHSYHSY